MGRSYSTNAGDYQLLEEVGHGASATVYRAIYLPFNEVVAVKRLDLERCNSNLDDIRREAQTMSLIDHPNVVSAYCSFAVDKYLWVVMPFMTEGSCLHLMKTAYPDGFEERAICSILKETLKALEYLHRQGHIHRDVKAGNILLDANGLVKLGDFGVSACMFDNGDRKRSRNTFVGTPCWMAPEVLQPGNGYDFKADIWSFGITALELAHGHAPFSKYPPMKVLLMTIQNAPPGLDYERDKKFSKSFKEMVAICLVKDPTKRPTAEKLLKHSFFKHAKPPEVSVKKLFADMPPLWERVKFLQAEDAAQLVLKRMPSAEQEAMSQNEYKRGVSAWNFDIEDLKAQASLIQGDDNLPDIKEGDESVRSASSSKDLSDSGSISGKFVIPTDVGREQVYADEVFPEPTDAGSSKARIFRSELFDYCNLEPNILQKDRSGPQLQGAAFEKDTAHSKMKCQTVERGHVLERPENQNKTELEKSNHDVRRVSSFSSPLMLPTRASANSLSAPIGSSGGYKDSLEDKSKTSLVQVKGRFSVTSENVDLVKDTLSCTVRRSSQGSPLRKSASVGDWISESKQTATNPPSKDNCIVNVSTSFILPHLQNLLQQSVLQQDVIKSLLNSFQPSEVVDVCQNGDLALAPLSHSPENGSVETATSERERLLLTKIIELEARMINLTEELSAEKQKYVQLQQQLNVGPGPEEDNNRVEGVA